MNNVNLHGIKNTLLPCPPEIYETLKRISEASPHISVSAAMNCTMNEHDNTLSGWSCTFPPDTPVSMLPFQPNMFDGITIVETLASEHDVLDLIKNKTMVMQKIKTFAQRHLPSMVRNRASWTRCRPVRELPLQRTETWNFFIKQETLARYSTLGEDCNVQIAADAPMDYIPDDTIPNYIDAENWDCELSTGGFIALYHRWHTLTDGTRTLKLYIVCQSSCQKAGLEIKHIINDIPYQTTIFDFASSEELWWLSNVNMRNRNRLILELADELKIEVPQIEDQHACKSNMSMAQPLAHNFLYGLYMDRDGRVSVAHDCIPTMHVTNGMITKLSPWEGIWLFKGPHANTVANFGTSFGTKSSVFPLSTVRLNSTTETQARKTDLIVQTGSPSAVGFWCDGGAEQRTRVRLEQLQRQQLPPTGNVQTESTQPQISPEEYAKLKQNFFWDGDTDFLDLAFDAWLKVRYGVNSNHTHDVMDMESSVETTDTESKMFLSFDDHFILEQLKSATHWDPRYGVMKLIPLCIYTNDM